MIQPNSKSTITETRPVIACPFCASPDIVKKGRRQKKYEVVQLYHCKRCHRRFTPLIHKNRTYPLKVIQDALTLYNRLYSLEEVSELIEGRYGLRLSLQTVANWLKDFKKYLLVLKLRPQLAARYDRRLIFIESRLLHGQVYDFKYHQAKLDLILRKKNGNETFQGLAEYLEDVPITCPHELFRANAKEKLRSSQHKNILNMDGVRIRSISDNAAIQFARFVLQAVAQNKLRHETVQQFLLINDSVTVAMEVPVILTEKDIHYFRNQLRFNLPLQLQPKEVITGHIDLVQIRNGMIHILDYKPGAKKEKPIEQLTLYALALSRLLGLRLYHFKCAWFDDQNYYEFYPLHVVYKKASRNFSRDKQK